MHTDKADIEVEVFAGGVIEQLLVEPGQEVPVGTPLALIREDGKAPSPAPAAAPPAPSPPAAPAPSAPTPASAPAAEHVLASPSAKQLAEELGVDLAAVAGSGPGGRIQRARRRGGRRGGEGPARAGARSRARCDSAGSTACTDGPCSGRRRDGRPPGAAMRRAIAAAMARSKREAPHFYLGETIDLSRAVAWLAEENLRRPVTDRLLHGVLLLKAVALALGEVPELNATWQGDTVVRSEGVHLGVAIFLRGGGLVAPAIHDADDPRRSTT